MAQRAERVITCSYYMREHVCDIFDLDEPQVSVIPNGIDPMDLQPVDDLDTLRARFAAPDEKLVLLVGRLVYEKGFQLALDALRTDHRGRWATSASWSPARARTRRSSRLRREELGLLEHGTFLGWIGDDVLHSLYRIADLCVVPSIYEPFGLVALEAMASGCPCIVADTGGLREVVPEGERVGLRFNGGDAEHLGVMIERLLTDDALRDRLVAEAGRARAELRLGRRRAADRCALRGGSRRGGLCAVLSARAGLPPGSGLCPDPFPRLRRRPEPAVLAGVRQPEARHVAVDALVLACPDLEGLVPDADVSAVDADGLEVALPRLGVKHVVTREALEVVEASPDLDDQRFTRRHQRDACVEHADVGVLLVGLEHRPHRAEHGPPELQLQRLVDAHPDQEDDEVAVHVGRVPAGEYRRHAVTVPRPPWRRR